MKVLFPIKTGALCAKMNRWLSGQDAVDGLAIVIDNLPFASAMDNCIKPTWGGVSGALNCMHDQQAVITKDNEQSKRRYIVRRLSPTECARLQGFPDDWHTNLINENPSEEEMQFWRKVFDDYCRIFGKKKKTDKQIRKFLATEPSDANVYKLYGNAISIPCANDVLQGIVDLVEEEENEQRSICQFD